VKTKWIVVKRNVDQKCKWHHPHVITTMKVSSNVASSNNIVDESLFM